MNALVLRLAGPVQPRDERSALTPGRDTASFPTRAALLCALDTAQSIPHQDTGALHHYAALEFTVQVDRPGGRLVDHQTTGGGQPNNQTAAARGGRGSRHAHRVRRSLLLHPARPQPQPAPAPPHRRTFPLAPGHRPRTLPTNLIDYAMKEAAA
ncbi:type I-E CRISPR-associated protein Cas5/CasD [Streptomyces sp. NPDC006134]|uniref:type I-E CRISPR-associated protein Cas5/CasD n=1 Tax=Streptomyces sp. NPDC006134 TaxID=3154467 RepID=UPI0033F7D566